LEAENAQPAYAEGFGVAGAHLSRHSGATAERPTSNVEWAEEKHIYDSSPAIRPDGNAVTMKELNERQHFASHSGAASTSPECFAA
jgi:hypothetical protein